MVPPTLPEHVVREMDLDERLGDLSKLETQSRDNIVEAVNELFQFANNGKTAMASVIGPPVQSTDRWSDIVAKVRSSKSVAVDLLSRKGVAASENESVALLFGRIADIETSNGPDLALAVGTWIGADWSDDIVSNEYGKFVRNGSYVDLAVYPQLSGSVTEIPQMVTPEMTADSSPAPYRAFASGGTLSTTSQPWHAFASGTTNGYMSASTSTNSRTISVTLDFGQKRKIVKAVVDASTFGTNKTYTAYGSDDNVNFSAISVSSSNTSATVVFSVTEQYRYYKIELQCWQSSSTTSTSRIRYVSFYAPSLYRIETVSAIGGRAAYLKYG